jgi:hypothetical protein
MTIARIDMKARNFRLFGTGLKDRSPQREARPASWRALPCANDGFVRGLAGFAAVGDSPCRCRRHPHLDCAWNLTFEVRESERSIPRFSSSFGSMSIDDFAIRLLGEDALWFGNHDDDEELDIRALKQADD